MIGLPEILILVLLFFLVAGPVAAGVVIWKYVIKPKQTAGSAPERKKLAIAQSRVCKNKFSSRGFIHSFAVRSPAFFC